jgi:hypothetical protein
MILQMGKSQVVEQPLEAAANAAASAARSAEVVFALLGFAAVGVFVVWVDNDGGYQPEQWLPGMLLVTALLATASASAEARARMRRAWLPISLLGLYACFSYVTTAWAGAPGDALDGANRTALYAVVFALFVGLARDALRLVLPVVWAGAVILDALVHFLHAAAAPGPRGFFILGRLATPVTYPDAEAAVLLTAALTLGVVAARRESPLPLRALAGGLATVGVELAIMAQSRGSLVALPLAFVAWLVISRNVLRTLVAIAVVAAAAAPATPVLLDVFGAVVNGKGYGAHLADARTTVALSSGAAAGVFVLVALADRRWTVPPAVCRTIRWAVAAAAVLVAAGAVAGAFAFSDPPARLRHAWVSFTTNAGAPPDRIHLASGVGTSRYDVWRIALRQFAAHPVGGVGADNYLAGYLRDRRTVETARYPESLLLRALSETGVVGALLFFGFLAAAIVAAVRAVRREPPLGPVAVAAVPAAYWLLHASVDWFWEFPGLTAPALAFLALAAARAGPPGPAAPSARRRALATAAAAAAAAVCHAAVAAVFCAWVAVRKIDLAVREGSTPHAYALLASAARWNPFSDQPQLTEAALAANVLDRPREVRALHAALRRNGADWYAHLMLGIAAGRQGDRRLAAEELREARALSPLEPVVIYAQNNLRVGNALTEGEIARVFAIRSRTLRGEAQR